MTFQFNCRIADNLIAAMFITFAVQVTRIISVLHSALVSSRVQLWTLGAG
jgi:hypothetical protein